MPRENKTAAKEETNGQEEAQAEAVLTVSMIRDEPDHPGGPTTADVHPDEVANYEAGGWIVKA